MNRFVLMAILAGVGQCAVSGADFTSGNLCYDLLADGSVEVAAPDEGMVYGGVLTVPAIVRHGSVQRQVSGIGSHAFSGCRDLTGITLSEGISYIGAYAFYKCNNLESVKLPSSLSVIEGRAFAMCGRLADIQLPLQLSEIGENAFSYCSSLGSIGRLATYANLGYGCFSYCTSLQSVDLADHYGNIGSGVFMGCSSLWQVKLREDMPEIAAYTFADCVSLTDVTLPEGLSEIGNWAFSGCTALKKLYIPPTISGIGERAFAGCSSIVRLDFSDKGGAAIGEGAFENLSNLPWVFLQGVESIGDSGFAGCTSLEWIEIERSVEEIGSRAFANCINLKRVYSHSDWPARITVNTFDTSTERDGELLVFPDSRDRYSLAAYWNRFVKISATERFPLSANAIADDEISVSACEGVITIGGTSVETTIYDISGHLLYQGLSEYLVDYVWPGGIYLVTVPGRMVKIRL